ncbi:chloride channel protein [Adlercreutzia sp. R21]|uniref:chloride channel protein n=1 Tax=Adlercreutzia wanghongyangiae TaxID=3111451 RepID=UPI002DB7E440|nr:chloride channel protein [Adlercreutzia sp. R21]MEC4183376.1 chloride channel protein [Adlercreutzia sp. R21]
MSVIDGRQVLRHGAFALVVGVVGAAASVVLCLVVNGAFGLLGRFPALLMGLPLFALASLALYRRYGVPLNTTTRSVARRIREDEVISPWLAPDILVGTALSILGGASVGKEAGALHMGASLGQLVARPFHLRSVYRSDAACGKDRTGMSAYAASAGMAAAFSALFFAPLGSAAFVMELTGYRREVVRHLPTLLLGCAVAWAGASLTGVGDVIPKVALPAVTWRVAGACVLVGAVAGVAGGLFGSAIDHVQRATEHIRRNYYLWATVGSALFVALVLGAGWQAFEGTGAVQLAEALAGRAGAWDFAVKALLTLLCLGFWLRGGEIMPTFTVGALLGVSCTAMTGGDAGTSAALGLVAFFCAMSRCPLAAFLMGCEIFGWEGAPLFALAVATAYLVRRGEGYYALGATSMMRDALGRRRRRRRATGRPAAQGEGRNAASEAAGSRRSARLVDDATRLVRTKAAEVEEELETHGDDAVK